jgi:hypothetical protein
MPDADEDDKKMASIVEMVWAECALCELADSDVIVIAAQLLAMVYLKSTCGGAVDFCESFKEALLDTIYDIKNLRGL